MENTTALPSIELLASCRLCARRCGINRLAGETGFCRAGALPRLALASLHYWEEPCISGSRGSGTVFFSRCNLACVYCQNHDISQNDQGIEVSVERLAEIFLEQQQQGAHNLNLVTPTPYVPQIIAALSIARGGGLDIPVIYNTSAYETLETVAVLRGWIDVYLPDLKYCDDDLALHYSNAPCYYSHALQSIQAMRDQVGECLFDADGIIRRGVLIRHLALPGCAADSRAVLDALLFHFGPSVWFSLMGQYTPQPGTAEIPDLHRRLSEDEYTGLIDYALSLGIENGFVQEEGSASAQYIPKFNFKGVIAKGDYP